MDDVTIYSIAKETGVSPSTVSRVLNNNPHVSKETRAKIMKALDDAGYIPNDTARNLVTKSSMMIGILLSDIRETLQSNTVHTIEQEFTKEGYSCLIYNTGNDVDRLQSYIRLLMQKKVDGVILMGSTNQSEVVREAVGKNFSKIPVIAVNGVMEGENVYSIYCDMKSGIIQVMDSFMKKNRTHIGFVYATESAGVKVFEEDVRQYLAGREGVEFYTARTERRPEEICDRIKALLAEHPETDGLLFADDYLAMGGIRGLVDCGKKVPEEVSVIGLGNSRYTRAFIPRITSLDTRLYDCALITVRTMLQVLKGEYVPKNLMMSPNLVERES